MAKVTRNTLAKGIKLLRQMVYQPLTDVAALLSAPSIQAANLQQAKGSFRIVFNWPVVDWRMFREVSASTNASFFGTLGVPFMVPPLQEFWDANGKTSPTTPRVTLTEVAISFDQRAEAAGVRGDAGADYGKSDSNIIGQYTLEVRLLEKLPTKYGGVVGTADREVYSTTIDSSAFSSRTGRLNPFALSDLKVDFNPFRVYLLQILAKDMSSNHNAMLPSLTVALRFTHPIVKRDQNPGGGVLVQNMPLHAGAKTPPVVAITTPAAGALIAATAGSGVANQFNVVDAVLRAKLEGGYTKDSNVPVSETVLDDSTYEVIAVPCFASMGSELAMTAANAAEIPYGGVAPFAGPACYRHIIPIQYPMVIHHVLATCNYGKPPVAGGTGLARLPSSATVAYDVGVLIGRGLRGDKTSYQQVARLAFKPSDAVNIVDKVKSSLKNTLTNGAFDYEVRAVPLVQPGAANGQGFNAQGAPFFVGWSTTNTQGRSNCGDLGGASGAPLTEGGEQWIEVRWSIGDAGGLAANTAAPPGAAASPDETYTGMGGHWVFIIGKKTAAMAQGDIRQ